MLDELSAPGTHGATVAVPLSVCPAGMRLGSEAAAQPDAADGEADAAKTDEQIAGDWLGALSGEGDVGGQFGELLTRRRWKPWQLEQAAAAAAKAAEAATPGVDQAAAAAAGVAVPDASSAGGLDSQELQVWRQGVLGLWKQPYLRVKLELLPLEQQQDPAALSSLSKAKDLESVDGGRDSGLGMPQQQKVVGDSFCQAPSLLLLGRIVG